MRQSHTTAHRSTRVNALAEIKIQALEAVIRTGDLTQSSWLSRLLPGVGAINTGVNQTTGISSVEMRTGKTLEDSLVCAVSRAVRLSTVYARPFVSLGCLGCYLRHEV